MPKLGTLLLNWAQGAQFGTTNRKYSFIMKMHCKLKLYVQLILMFCQRNIKYEENIHLNGLNKAGQIISGKCTSLNAHLTPL